MRKLIAIGNRLMGDDAIGMCVAEKLMEEHVNDFIEVIIGETDVDYCLDNIKDADEVFILDAVLTFEQVGEVMVEELGMMEHSQASHFAHDLNLIQQIGIHGKRVSGCVIGIGVSSVEMRLGISSDLEQKFEGICRKVEEIIKQGCV